MTDDERDRHEAIRARLYAQIVEDGAIQAQPLSEGIAKGATAGVMTKATPVDGGFLVSGRKIFASLAGAAGAYNLTCIVPGEERLRFLSVAADNPGVQIAGDWDTLGMRGTDSRDLVFEDAFVPAEAELLPPGFFDQIAERWPYVYMTLTPAYVGLTRRGRGVRARVPLGRRAPGTRRGATSSAKQWGWAEIQIMAEPQPGDCGSAPSPRRRRPDARAAAARLGVHVHRHGDRAGGRGDGDPRLRRRDDHEAACRSSSTTATRAAAR